MKLAVLALALIGGGGGLGACDGGSAGDRHAAADARRGDGAALDAAAVVDLDGDGVADATELAWATAYRPYLSVAPDDGCPLGGLVVRVHPHPADPTLIAIVYDHLFERDCGLGGHVGDNEVFGVTIDPAVPPPAGIIAIKAASHQGTLCEIQSECGRCPGQGACDTTLVAGVPTPVVYSSRDKHATYARLTACGGVCLDQCTLAPTSDAPPIANAGEPGAALIDDLTAQGFITTANGWTEPAVFGFDPWGPADFGTAGNVADDLVDPTFVAAACR